MFLQFVQGVLDSTVYLKKEDALCGVLLWWEFGTFMYHHLVHHTLLTLHHSTDNWVSPMQVPGVVDDALLATLVSSVEDELEATEWATRKAAADTLACLATALGPALSHSKTSSTAALVACRFDKVFRSLSWIHLLGFESVSTGCPYTVISCLKPWEAGCFLSLVFWRSVDRRNVWLAATILDFDVAEWWGFVIHPGETCSR